MANPMSQDAKLEAMKAAQAVKGRSLWQDARRRLFRNKAAVVSMIILSIIVLLALLAPYLSQHRYDAQDYNQVSCPPSWTIDMTKLNPPEGAAPDSEAYKAYEDYNNKYPQTVACGMGIISSYEFAKSDWQSYCADPSITPPPEVNCARETTAKGAALAVAALFPARGLCNVSWGFYKGKKTLAVSAMLRQRDTKLPAKLQTVLKSIKLGN